MVLFLLLSVSIYSEAAHDSTTTHFSQKLRHLTTLPIRGGIRFYQVFISSQDLPTCTFNPTCSRFSMAAYKTTDPIQATFMSFDRLMRCNYFIYGEYPFVENRFIDPIENHMLWGKHHSGLLSASTHMNFIPNKSHKHKYHAVSCTPEPDIMFADAMTRMGETDLALEEYERLSGKEYPGNIRIQALFRSGWTLIETGEYDGAASKFKVARSLAGEDSQISADAALLEHLALTVCNAGKADVYHHRDNSFEKSVHEYISVWGKIHQGLFSEARCELDSLERSPNSELSDAAGSTAALVDSLAKSVNKKGWISGPLSALVPGLGRFYTGRYGDAFFSFFVTVGTGGLAARALKSGPWTKGAFFCGAAAGYYTGNIYGSIISARTENSRARMFSADHIESEAKQLNILPEQIISRLLAHHLPANQPGNKTIYEAAALQSRKEGDKYFAEKNWRQAVRSYYRCMFFSPENTASDSVLFGLGRSLELNGKDPKAQAVYEQFLDRHPESDLTGETRVSLARLHIRNNRSALAKLELEDEMKYGETAKWSKEAFYLTTGVFLQDRDWDGVREWINEHSGRFRHGETYWAVKTIRKKLEGSSTLPDKSPDKARYLSMVVPGLGQTYAGKPFNGFGAFLVNGTIAYSIARSAHSGNWLDAGLIFVLLFDRFYKGNIRNAERFCLEFNENQQKRLQREIRDEVRQFSRKFDPFVLE